MKTAIIGKKVGMTQIFDEAGKVVPVTVIEAGPCTVTGKMTKEKEGYEAVQLGYEDVAEKKLTKPEKGHLDKAGVGYKKHLKEFRLEDCASVNVGDVIKADTFKEGDKVDITGISKGHGYAGVIKRFGQGRTPTSHGGVAFAPKPRDYSYTLNKKVKRLALKSALSAKAAAGEILVVDGLAVEEIKTAPVKAFLTKIGAEGKALLVTEQVDEKVVKSSRNIPGVSSTIATILSPYMILTHRVLVVDKAALQKIEEVYA